MVQRMGVTSLVLAGLMLGSGSARAGLWNHVHVYMANDVVGCCWYVQEGAYGVMSEGYHLGHQLGWYSFQAAANAGLVQSWILNHVDGNTQLNTARQTAAHSTIDDLVFTDGTGVPKPVTFYVKLHVEGGSTGDPGDPDHQGCFVSRLRLISGQIRDGNYLYGWGGASCGGTSSGFLASETGPSFSGDYVVGPFNVTSEQNVSLGMYLDMYVSASVAWAVPGYSEATGHIFANLVVGEPAIISEGFNANSAEAGIVDNYYQQVLATESLDPPDHLRLAQSTPNPTSSRSTISFQLPRSGPAAVTIYDVSGRAVRRLADRSFEAGSHTLIWDGRDEHGARVRPGVYLYRLRQGADVLARSMVVLGR